MKPLEKVQGELKQYIFLRVEFSYLYNFSSNEQTSNANTWGRLMFFLDFPESRDQTQ